MRQPSKEDVMSDEVLGGPVLFPPTIVQGEAHLVMGPATIHAEGTVTPRTVKTTTLRFEVSLPGESDPGCVIEVYNVKSELVAVEPGADFADSWFRIGEDLEEGFASPSR